MFEFTMEDSFQKPEPLEICCFITSGVCKRRGYGDTKREAEKVRFCVSVTSA